MIRGRKLDTPLKYQHAAFVTGDGAFPIDMLRYEGAFPAEETDSNRIGHVEETRTVRLIKFSSEREPRWNHARWHSFGWTLQACEEQRSYK